MQGELGGDVATRAMSWGAELHLLGLACLQRESLAGPRIVTQARVGTQRRQNNFLPVYRRLGTH